MQAQPKAGQVGKNFRHYANECITAPALNRFHYFLIVFFLSMLMISLIVLTTVALDTSWRQEVTFLIVNSCPSYQHDSYSRTTWSEWSYLVVLDVFVKPKNIRAAVDLRQTKRKTGSRCWPLAAVTRQRSSRNVKSYAWEPFSTDEY